VVSPLSPSIARPLHARDLIGVVAGAESVRSGSTTIDLCLSLFAWAKFRRRKAAVKMNTLLDLHGNVPTLIRVARIGGAPSRALPISAELGTSETLLHR